MQNKGCACGCMGRNNKNKPKNRIHISKLIFCALLLSYQLPQADNVNHNNNNRFLFMAPNQSKMKIGGWIFNIHKYLTMFLSA